MVDEYFERAQELSAKGLPFVTAVVVRAEKPTSGRPGDKAIITADGRLYGWIGGSCAQPTVIREAQKAMSEGKNRFIRLSSENDPSSRHNGLMEFPMTCYSEGVLEIFIEPHLPKPQLLVIGTMPVARALLEIGRVMEYHTLAVALDQSEDVSHADTVLTTLGVVMENITPETYVVVASHGNYDEAALEHVLKAKPRYVGLVASAKRYQSVVDYLKEQGLSDEDLKPLKAPAGLDIKAERADEIALSILAEIIQLRRTTPLSVDWQKVQKLTSTADVIPLTLMESVPQKNVAIDPVCGMEVDKSTVAATYEYEGETYYFCCNGCKGAFARSPEEYIKPTIAIDPICKMEVTIATAVYTSEYEGQTYYFCCAGCKSTFEKNPETYVTATETT